MEHPDYNAKEHRYIRHLRFLSLGWAISSVVGLRLSPNPTRLNLSVPTLLFL